MYYESLMTNDVCRKVDNAKAGTDNRHSLMASGERYQGVQETSLKLV